MFIPDLGAGRENFLGMRLPRSFLEVIAAKPPGFAADKFRSRT